jgi:hypothetical protein
MTNVKSQKGACACLMTAIGIPFAPVLFGIGLIVMAQCTDTCDDFVHSCPKCRTYLGTYKVL